MWITWSVSPHLTQMKLRKKAPRSTGATGPVRRRNQIATVKSVASSSGVASFWYGRRTMTGPSAGNSIP